MHTTDACAGVVYLNVTAMHNAWDSLLAHARRRRFAFRVADQSWLNEYFRNGSRTWVPLDDALYNARPFLHPRRYAVTQGLPQGTPRIWHWHGYKPRDVHCWLRMMSMGVWPWRAPSCAGKKKRARFVAELLALCEKHGFDGVDYNWEYPGYQFGRGYLSDAEVEKDYHGLRLLLKETHAVCARLHAAFDDMRLLMALTQRSRTHLSVAPRRRRSLRPAA